MKREMRSVEKGKLDALVSENIRLRHAANQLWMKSWFPMALIVAVGTAAFCGAWIAIIVMLVEG